MISTDVVDLDDMIGYLLPVVISEVIRLVFPSGRQARCLVAIDLYNIVVLCDWQMAEYSAIQE